MRPLLGAGRPSAKKGAPPELLAWRKSSPYVDRVLTYFLMAETDKIKQRFKQRSTAQSVNTRGGYIAYLRAPSLMRCSRRHLTARMALSCFQRLKKTNMRESRNQVRSCCFFCHP